MDFKDFISESVSDLEIVSKYFNGKESVRNLSKIYKKSIGDIYRIIHAHGKPNRHKKNYSVIKSLHDSGLSNKSISNLVGYSNRHILNILKNGNNPR